MLWKQVISKILMFFEYYFFLTLDHIHMYLTHDSHSCAPSSTYDLKVSSQGWRERRNTLTAITRNGKHNEPPRPEKKSESMMEKARPLHFTPHTTLCLEGVWRENNWNQSNLYFESLIYYFLNFQVQTFETWSFFSKSKFNSAFSSPEVVSTVMGLWATSSVTVEKNSGLKLEFLCFY